MSESKGLVASPIVRVIEREQRARKRVEDIEMKFTYKYLRQVKLIQGTIEEQRAAQNVILPVGV